MTKNNDLKEKKFSIMVNGFTLQLSSIFKTSLGTLQKWSL